MFCVFKFMNLFREEQREGQVAKKSKKRSRRSGSQETSTDGATVKDEAIAGEHLPASTAMLYEYIRSPLVKRLLNQIIATQEAHGFKSVTILSDQPKEGKSFFTAALALGLSSFLRRRVLIIDTVSKERAESLFACVLAPALARGYTSEGSNGSSSRDWAGGTIDLVTTSAEKHKVYVHHDQSPPQSAQAALPPVPYKPSQLYETAEFHLGNLVTALSPSYDLILVDTCALSQVTNASFDPLIMAKQSDCSILITTNQTLGREAITKIRTHLQQAQIRLIGTVYNRPVS